MKFLLKQLLLMSLIAVLVISCGKKSDEGSTDVGSEAATAVTGDFTIPSSGMDFTFDGTPVNLAGVTFTPASEWTDYGPSGMRKASYAFGPHGDDADSATVTVFYFGEGGGGTIQANLDRWVGQMQLAEGADPNSFVQKGETMVGDMKAHLLRVDGSYSAGGMMGMGTPVIKENYIMVGVVLEAPEGNIFFKLTGPKQTGFVMTDALLGMVNLVKKI